MTGVPSRESRLRAAGSPGTRSRPGCRVNATSGHPALAPPAMQARAQIPRICTITGNIGTLKSATYIGGSVCGYQLGFAWSVAPIAAAGR